VEPMLATPTDRPGVLPSGADWAYEVKWDGVRALADTTGERLRLWSRNERDVTVAYPELAALESIQGAVLDGEIVLLEAGVPSFAALAERMHVRDARRAAALAERRPVTYVVFDVLRLYGVDLVRSSYDERRATLARLELPEHVQLSPVYPDGEALWRATEEHGLEGVVAKRRSSSYAAGRRSTDWVKAAHRRTRTALVAGWKEESTGSGRLGSLLVGALDDAGTLRFLGSAGSGLTGGSARDLERLLRARPLDKPPFDEPVPAADARGAHWAAPDLVVDLRYLNRTPSGRLRQPVVRGLRTDTGPDPWERA
jgi:bifunctional non-homologous end joining protein LigD